jgi:hypothetical protein
MEPDDVSVPFVGFKGADGLRLDLLNTRKEFKEPNSTIETIIPRGQYRLVTLHF